MAAFPTHQTILIPIISSIYDETMDELYSYIITSRYGYLTTPELGYCYRQAHNAAIPFRLLGYETLFDLLNADQYRFRTQILPNTAHVYNAIVQPQQQNQVYQHNDVTEYSRDGEACMNEYSNGGQAYINKYSSSGQAFISKSSDAGQAGVNQYSIRKPDGGFFNFANDNKYGNVLLHKDEGVNKDSIRKPGESLINFTSGDEVKISGSREASYADTGSNNTWTVYTDVVHTHVCAICAKNGANQKRRRIERDEPCFQDKERDDKFYHVECYLKKHPTIVINYGTLSKTKIKN